MKMMQYNKSLKIVNLDQLPLGTGVKYLEVIKGQGEELIAVRWRRNPVYPKGHILINFTIKKEE